ncbi:MAG: glycosyltransferase family 9 protein, partial [Acetobacteraceae bacterium]
RSSRSFDLLPHPRPEWSGIARGCSHPDRDQRRDALHDHERLAGQLRQAGIAGLESPDLGWCDGDIARFGLPERIALLVPGSSGPRLAKRWPAAQYGALARSLADDGIASVVLGTAAEAPLAKEIARVAQAAIDLTGRTGFGDLASLARAALLAVGNDTGPMHLIAVAGCPSLVLFSDTSDPALCAPRGDRVAILRRPSLDALDLAPVREAALGLLSPALV